MLAVSMYKLIWFSPSSDSEVVTALGWGCVHVTELRRGQVVCLVDGGTLRLLSQVPGLEDKRKSAIRATIWKITHFNCGLSTGEIKICVRGKGRFSPVKVKEWQRVKLKTLKLLLLSWNWSSVSLLGAANALSVTCTTKYLCLLERHAWYGRSNLARAAVAEQEALSPGFWLNPQRLAQCLEYRLPNKAEGEWMENGWRQRFYIIMDVFSDASHSISFSMRSYHNVLVTGTEDQNGQKSKWSSSRTSAVPRILGDFG